MSFDSLRRGLFARDSSIWSEETAVKEKIASRLGWLDGPQFAAKHAPEIMNFARQVREAGFQHVVLLAMGGSCLAPEVLSQVAGVQAGWPVLKTLDSTVPEQIDDAEDGLDLATTFFVVASKSGGTVETKSLYLYFRQRLLDADLTLGNHMAAITDAGSELEKIARIEQFRACFLNPTDIGGRYSAISYFGLVPSALAGVDIEGVIATANEALIECETGTGHGINLAQWIGDNWQHGRDKLGLVLPGGIQALGWWIEQLVAESLGKQGKGVLPWAASLPEGEYADDMYFAVWGDPDVESGECLMPQRELKAVADLGAEFVHWEVATAITGALLKLNPFDEPDVADAKQMTSKIMSQGVVDINTTGEEVSSLVSQLGETDYLNILAYLPDIDSVRQALNILMSRIRQQTNRPILLSWGPRYLHSNGQLHKGGANQGVFLVLVGNTALDKPIPGQDYGFRSLMLAQAQGDFKVLQERNRRVGYLSASLAELANLVL